MDEKLSAEQAAERARLAAEAEAEQPSLEGETIQAQPVDLASELASYGKIIVTILGKPLPSIAELYTDDVLSTVSAAVAGVCNKHGWLQNGLGPYGEEIAAAALLIPLGIATAQGVKKDIAAAKSRIEGQPKNEASGSPGGVTFGEPIP